MAVNYMAGRKTALQFKRISGIISLVPLQLFLAKFISLRLILDFYITTE